PNGIYSLGTSAPADNKYNIVTNNRVYDWYNSVAATCAGINLQGGNTFWTIGTIGNGNNVYQTSARTPVATMAFRPVLINNTSGNGFTINGNRIGGNISGIAGSTMVLGSSSQINTLAHSNYCIRLDVGSAIATNVE